MYCRARHFQSPQYIVQLQISVGSLQIPQFPIFEIYSSQSRRRRSNLSSIYCDSLADLPQSFAYNIGIYQHCPLKSERREYSQAFLKTELSSDANYIIKIRLLPYSVTVNTGLSLTSNRIHSLSGLESPASLFTALSPSPRESQLNQVPFTTSSFEPSTHHFTALPSGTLMRYFSPTCKSLPAPQFHSLH